MFDDSPRSIAAIRLLALTGTITFAAVTREDLSGTTFAEYSLHDMVGEGGTAVVYRAQHPQHGTVAVKVLREKLRNDRTAVTRFVREARYGTRVIHPNVIKTIEIGEARPGLHFLATEWATGELLERYAKRNAPLPPAEVTHIIWQIADAVQAAHDVGIIHRDLKPENLMYDPDAKQVKLLDFGIAAQTDLTPDERLTRAGFFVGTLMYVAPEALSGAMVTASADQYSLATIAYFLLSGCLPYTGKTQRELFSQLLSQPPVPLGAAKRGVPIEPAVEAVVMRALSRNPQDRYPTVKAFAEALRTAIEAPPTAAKRDGIFARVRSMFGKGDAPHPS
jgi:serine/threonine protein kinase